MSKPLKVKKEKVPKITEAQYAEYISSLKDLSETPQEHGVGQNAEKTENG